MSTKNVRSATREGRIRNAMLHEFVERVVQATVNEAWYNTQDGTDCGFCSAWLSMAQHGSAWLSFATWLLPDFFWQAGGFHAFWHALKGVDLAKLKGDLHCYFAAFWALLLHCKAKSESQALP